MDDGDVTSGICLTMRSTELAWKPNGNGPLQGACAGKPVVPSGGAALTCFIHSTA